MEYGVTRPRWWFAGVAADQRRFPRYDKPLSIDGL